MFADDKIHKLVFDREALLFKGQFSYNKYTCALLLMTSGNWTEVTQANFIK